MNSLLPGVVRGSLADILGCWRSFTKSKLSREEQDSGKQERKDFVAPICHAKCTFKYQNFTLGLILGLLVEVPEFSSLYHVQNLFPLLPLLVEG